MLKLTLNWMAFLAFVAVMLCSSCSDTKPTAQGIENSIPVNASVVMLMNTKQLLEKADMDALKQTNFYKDMLSELEKESSEAKSFFEDPASAGFDLNSNMGFYAAVADDNPSEFGTDVAFIMPVLDISKVEATLKKSKKTQKKYPVTEQDGYKKVSINGKVFLVFNDKTLAFTNFEQEDKIKNILSPSGENIRSNENFNKHFKEGKDALFWMQADDMIEKALRESNSEAKIKSGLAMAQLSEDILTNNNISAYYDFQKGSIEAGANFDFSQALIDEMGDFMATELNVDYAKYIPQENLAMAVSFGINPAGILNFISKRGFDKMVDAQLSMFQLDLETIKNGITGDMALGIYPADVAAGDPNGILALGVKDQAFIQGLIDKYGALAGIVKDGDNYVMMGGQSMDDPSAEPKKIILHLKENVLLVSNSIQLLDKALKEGNNELLAEMQKGWMGMYVNYELSKQFKDLLSNVADSPSDVAFTKMLMQYNELKDLKFLCKGTSINFQTSLAKGDINSLKRLIEIAAEVYKDKEKIMEEFEKSLDNEDEFEGFEEEFGEAL